MASSKISSRGFLYIVKYITATSTGAHEVASIPYPGERVPKGLIITKGAKDGSSTKTLTDLWIQQVTSNENVSYIRYQAPETGNYRLHCLYLY